MADDASTGRERRAELARILGVDSELVDYVDDESINRSRDQEQGLDAGALETEDVSDTDTAAAQSRGLVVPNRISYGVYLQQGGFGPNGTLYTWVGLRDTCTHTGWVVPQYITSQERAGWCRRPQTDVYDVRYKIYWRA